MSAHVPLRVQIDAFEGPLDLLLHLIEIRELDITKLAISQITDPYLAYVQQMQKLNFDAASEFLVVAATLIFWKSRSLLPPQVAAEDVDAEGAPELSPEELVRRLSLHRLYGQAGDLLGQRPRLGEHVFKRHNPKAPSLRVWQDCEFTAVAIAYQQLLERARKRIQVLRKETVSITERIQEILQRLRIGELTEMVSLLSVLAKRADEVATFLALLELGRTKRIRLYQETTYAPLFLELVAAPEASGQNETSAPIQEISEFDLGSMRLEGTAG